MSGAVLFSLFSVPGCCQPDPEGCRMIQPQAGSVSLHASSAVRAYPCQHYQQCLGYLQCCRCFSCPFLHPGKCARMRTGHPYGAVSVPQLSCRCRYYYLCCPESVRPYWRGKGWRPSWKLRTGPPLDGGRQYRYPRQMGLLQISGRHLPGGFPHRRSSIAGRAGPAY